MSISLRAKLCAKNPAMNSDTSPRRCRPRSRSGAVGASSASDSICTSGFEAHAVGGPLEQLLRAREQRQQIDDVLLSLVFDCHMLVRERALQRSRGSTRAGSLPAPHRDQLTYPAWLLLDVCNERRRGSLIVYTPLGVRFPLIDASDDSIEIRKLRWQ